MILYMVMTLLYLLAAALVAFDSSLTNLALLPWFNGLRWLRIHLITIGAVVQALFGLLPALVAHHAGRRRPPTRLDIWLGLNVGLLLLLVGIPLINEALIVGGGTLIFVAAALLWHQLRSLRPAQAAAPRGRGSGRPFYLAGLAFFLLGIIAGTGLFLGWGGPLQMVRPKEVHLHANIWGLISLTFAGLLVDLVPRLTGRPLAWRGSIRPIFWLMSAGSVLLLAAPWLGEDRLTGPGMVLHIGGTAWLLLNVIVPLRGDRQAWAQPGLWHLVTAYAWVLTPLVAAPLIRSGVVAMPQAAVEQDAPQWLIYAWVLHFGYALLPTMFRRAFTPREPAALEGSWLTLAGVHLGSAFFWVGIFNEPDRGTLYAIAYALWAAAMLPVGWRLGRITLAGLARLEDGEVAVVGPANTVQEPVIPFAAAPDDGE